MADSIPSLRNVGLIFSGLLSELYSQKNVGKKINDVLGENKQKYFDKTKRITVILKQAFDNSTDEPFKLRILLFKKQWKQLVDCTTQLIDTNSPIDSDLLLKSNKIHESANKFFSFDKRQVAEPKQLNEIQYLLLKFPRVQEYFFYGMTSTSQSIFSVYSDFFKNLNTFATRVLQGVWGSIIQEKYQNYNSTSFNNKDFLLLYCIDCIKRGVVLSSLETKWGSKIFDWITDEESNLLVKVLSKFEESELQRLIHAKDINPEISSVIETLTESIQSLFNTQEQSKALQEVIELHFNPRASHLFTAALKIVAEMHKKQKDIIVSDRSGLYIARILCQTIKSTYKRQVALAILELCIKPQKVLESKNDSDYFAELRYNSKNNIFHGLLMHAATIVAEFNQELALWLVSCIEKNYLRYKASLSIIGPLSRLDKAYALQMIDDYVATIENDSSLIAVLAKEIALYLPESALLLVEEISHTSEISKSSSSVQSKNEEYNSIPSELVDASSVILRMIENSTHEKAGDLRAFIHKVADDACVAKICFQYMQMFYKTYKSELYGLFEHAILSPSFIYDSLFRDAIACIAKSDIESALKMAKEIQSSFVQQSCYQDLVLIQAQSNLKRAEEILQKHIVTEEIRHSAIFSLLKQVLNQKLVQEKEGMTDKVLHTQFVEVIEYAKTVFSNSDELFNQALIMILRRAAEYSQDLTLTLFNTYANVDNSAFVKNYISVFGSEAIIRLAHDFENALRYMKKVHALDQILRNESLKEQTRESCNGGLRQEIVSADVEIQTNPHPSRLDIEDAIYYVALEYCYIRSANSWDKNEFTQIIGLYPHTNNLDMFLHKIVKAELQHSLVTAWKIIDCMQNSQYKVNAYREIIDSYGYNNKEILLSLCKTIEVSEISDQCEKVLEKFQTKHVFERDFLSSSTESNFQHTIFDTNAINYFSLLDNDQSPQQVIKEEDIIGSGSYSSPVSSEKDVPYTAGSPSNEEPDLYSSDSDEQFLQIAQKVNQETMISPLHNDVGLDPSSDLEDFDVYTVINYDSSNDALSHSEDE